MNVIGVDAEAVEIAVSGSGISVKPRTCGYLNLAVDPTTRLISVGIELAIETDGKEKGFAVSFEDPIPNDALPKRAEVGVELRDLLDPKRTLDQVVGMAIAGFLALDAELTITCDDAAPNNRSVVELRLRVGELYEDAVERPYGELVDFLEPVAPDADDEIVRCLGLGLEPLPKS